MSGYIVVHLEMATQIVRAIPLPPPAGVRGVLVSHLPDNQCWNSHEFGSRRPFFLIPFHGPDHCVGGGHRYPWCGRMLCLVLWGNRRLLPHGRGCNTPNRRATTPFSKSVSEAERATCCKYSRNSSSAALLCCSASPNASSPTPSLCEDSSSPPTPSPRSLSELGGDSSFSAVDPVSVADSGRGCTNKRRGSAPR